MTANLSSFLRFKFAGGKGPVNEEQDLRGFEAGGAGRAAAAAVAAADASAALATQKSYMDTIQVGPGGRGVRHATLGASRVTCHTVCKSPCLQHVIACKVRP